MQSPSAACCCAGQQLSYPLGCSHPELLLGLLQPLQAGLRAGNPPWEANLRMKGEPCNALTASPVATLVGCL